MIEKIIKNNKYQYEFLQAVEEMAESLKPLLKQNPKYIKVFESLVEPDRIIKFKITWIDDNGETQINRGFRIQFNQALGPYKGGLRFHPSVNESILKFLGFEQIFKNALTGLNLGGGKGGSDFNPKGKSDREVLKFCKAFMTELQKYIGPNIDVPAGDIGVGGREIGYLYGQYKKIKTQHFGILTGKGITWGGSKLRIEATGYGISYITRYAMKDINIKLDGLKVSISGSGNVATYTARKMFAFGCKIISLSDSGGCLIKNNGFTSDDLDTIFDHKKSRGRLSELFVTDTIFYERSPPWNHVGCDIAIPCATQNEVNKYHAKKLVENGCKYYIEGSNMSSTNEAVKYMKEHCSLFIPSKVANCGGVMVSGFEMAQNSQRIFWSREKVNEELEKMMIQIYKDIKKISNEYGFKNDIQIGGNILSFLKVADAMLDQGMI